MNKNYSSTLSQVPGVLSGCMKSNLCSCKEIAQTWIVNALVFITEKRKGEKKTEETQPPFTPPQKSFKGLNYNKFFSKNKTVNDSALPVSSWTKRGTSKSLQYKKD